MSFGGFQANTGTGMFGAAKPATSGFGGFGTPATTSGGFAFGAQPAATSTAPTFGAPTTGFGTGLSFGAPQTGQLGTAQPTVQFGQTPATGFQLGNTSFGAQTSTAPTSFSGGSLTFGTPTTSATPSMFGTPAPTLGASVAPTVNFNLGGTSTPSTGFSLGAPTTAATSSFSFGLAKPTSTITSSAPLLLFGSATSTTPTLGFNLGGLSSSATTAALSTATSTTTVGLGGVDSSQTKTGLSGVGITEPKQLKDHQLPDQILQNFNDFKTFVKQQKNLSVDIAHSSARPLKKVQEDIDVIESLVADITNGLARNTVATEKLKTETANGLFNADMAQRLREAPSSLGYENGPERFFSELITRFETDAARLKGQVEASERHLRSITQSTVISPQELSVAMRRLHETLVVLAARTQSLHLSVLDGIEKYRHLRHVYLKEDLPVPSKPAGKRSEMKSLVGPIAFSETAGIANLSVDALSMLTGTGVPLMPTTTSSGLFGSQPGATNFLSSPNSSFLSSPQQADNSAFQLSKPPVGNKRNKR